ncbi:hypothetical protein KFE25_008666 [Diacronema lutheri]|uniref:Sucrose phosphatase-like domain-containing protein n=1 Tax=Diacronema lutheri TaxID=2081491 RepID=A0A8J5Y2K7_DIALT|nr:hypothetical protein KFE25_008666 [Diacronema lutheri]
MGTAVRPVRVVFSDLDGTLVHFEPWFAKHGVRVVDRESAADGESARDGFRAVVESGAGERRACRVLPPSTMGPGYVSDETVRLVDALRWRGVTFVVITAARKSTLLERLPHLPRADVYVCECGTRILYGDDLELDRDWAARFEHISGPLETDVPADERPQPLWQLCRRMREAGLAVDTRSYYGCFRVSATCAEDVALVEALRAELDAHGVIGCSINLGKFDFYPASCGKGNAVRYLQAKLGLPKADSAALFDDDNDLPMAEECDQQFLPALTSDSIVAAVRAHPQWRVAARCGQGVFAVEELLEALLAALPAASGGAAEKAREAATVAATR